VLRNRPVAASLARALDRSGVPFLRQFAQIVIADKARWRADQPNCAVALKIWSAAVS
jgi:hypothetical protein